MHSQVYSNQSNVRFTVVSWTYIPCTLLNCGSRVFFDYSMCLYQDLLQGVRCVLVNDVVNSGVIFSRLNDVFYLLAS